MADLSAFSSDEFDVSQWVNSAMRDKPEEEGLESYLAQLAMKLHIISQDYTDQLETRMVEAMSTMPRIMSEISRVEENLKSVEDEMHTLAEQIKVFDKKSVGGIEDLSRYEYQDIFCCIICAALPCMPCTYGCIVF
jgi:chromosome segregation ATPase